MKHLSDTQPSDTPLSSAHFLALLLAASLTGGCATTGEVCVKPVGDPALTPSAVAAGAYAQDAVVTWGGVVAMIHNLQSDTELDVIAFPLDSCGRPLLRGRAIGRFLVRRRGYLEPEDYRRGRAITATGRIREVQETRIGEARGQLPVLDESVIRLWPQRQAADVGYIVPIWPIISIGIGSGGTRVGGGIGIGIGF